jgi:hypothetical protein
MKAISNPKRQPVPFAVESREGGCFSTARKPTRDSRSYDEPIPSHRAIQVFKDFQLKIALLVVLLSGYGLALSRPFLKLDSGISKKKGAPSSGNG